MAVTAQGIGGKARRLKVVLSMSMARQGPLLRAAVWVVFARSCPSGEAEPFGAVESEDTR